MTAILNRDAHLTVGHAVEIVGKVNADLSVKVLRATDLGREGVIGMYMYTCWGRGRCKIEADSYP